MIYLDNAATTPVPAAGVIRISFSPDNTTSDVDALYDALKAHQAARFPML